MIHWEGTARKLKYLDADQMFYDLYITQGKTIQEMAKLLGTYYAPIHRQLLKRGIPLRDKGPQRFDIEISQEEFETKTLKELAKIYGVSDSVIRDRTKMYPRKRKRVMSNAHE